MRATQTVCTDNGRGRHGDFAAMIWGLVIWFQTPAFHACCHVPSYRGKTLPTTTKHVSVYARNRSVVYISIACIGLGLRHRLAKEASPCQLRTETASETATDESNA